ncbi:MAG: hypothetical protein GEU82_11330 [Luteitalea sp.]|nr:hypothetical protein [Luteitalea sp.]
MDQLAEMGSRSAQGRRHAVALLGYVVIALLFAWPLPRQLTTHLTGAPDGDTGVYVWNLWVFQHELLDHRSVPYFTEKIFASTGRANLSLHNYTAFANLLALPFVRTLGVVPTFNAIYIFLTVLTAYSMFLLAWRLTGGDATVAWLAGVLFAWSPILVTRGMGHFSLVAAAPLPIFLLLLLRLREAATTRIAIGLGLTVAWATACDVYYGVYCLMLIGTYLTMLKVGFVRVGPTPVRHAVASSLDIFAISVGGLVVALLVSHGWQFTFLGRVVRMRSLYTPLLILTALMALRAAIHYRPVLRPLAAGRLRATIAVILGAGAVSATLMSPLLLAATERLRTGRFVQPRIFWRSSPPGIDLLAWAVPNPNHPFAPAALRDGLAQLTRDGYLENVASIPLVALAVILIARRAGWRASWLGLAMTLGFGALALGPFLRIGGIDTHIPGPWALLRYVPVVGLARSPSRFAVVATMGVAILFAQALHALVAGRSTGRRFILALTGVLLVAELLPAPRTLYSATIPSVYDVIAADPSENAHVLELPFGLRDGTMTVGRATSRPQFHQTAHGKAILGGYLSRVSEKRIEDVRRDAVMNALLQFSEGKSLSAEQADRVRNEWPAFVRRVSIRYLVVDTERASPALRTFVVSTLKLQRLRADAGYELYRP